MKRKFKFYRQTSSTENLKFVQSKDYTILQSNFDYSHPSMQEEKLKLPIWCPSAYVIDAWNSHCYKEFLITRIEAKELMVEDWLTLNNSTVHQILPVAARTKELYARELILFLGEGIPQSPPVKLKTSQYFSTYH